MRRIACVLALLLVVALLAGCVPAANPDEGEGADPAGFWQGLWHGAIVWISFLVSLFNPDVGIYEVKNNGNWYNFGYLLGLSIALGGGCGGAAAGSKKRPGQTADAGRSTSES